MKVLKRPSSCPFVRSAIGVGLAEAIALGAIHFLSSACFLGRLFSWGISPRDWICASALSESRLIVFWKVQENAR